MAGPSKITDVIFDLDGTLIDSAPGILACFARTLATNGIEPALPLTSSLIGPPLRETLFKLSGVNDEAWMAAMIEDFKLHYDLDGYKKTVIFPGVDAMLRDLKAAGMRLHIATNKRLRPTELILAHLGWSELFCAVYALDLRKPSFSNKSEMLDTLLQAEGIAQTQAVYIGDRRDDWNAAQANALPFIAAVWGYRDDDFLASSEDPFAAEYPADIARAIVGSVG